ncbi:competence protein ComEA [Compostimonas suwonensis]|uniref:Competence protein ComEA n=1 Tax=Compostimonas suwonensis TaxID=1048394 RepID=A0A2M9BZ61_9MICO|nr:competence protein ComEA [Compostimonas suwonensis]
MGATIVLALVALVVAVLVSAVADGAATEPVVVSSPGDGGGVDPRDAAADAGGAGAAGASIFVHVTGAVASPGLFELAESARVIDAIAAAGGLSETADESAVNLARFVSDGEQLVVPQLGEVVAGVPGAAGGGAGAASGDGRVNLNTADSAALETLPRIGPAMAQRIIEWRDANGRFTSVDDLRQITGVGEKTFEALVDLVTV